MNSLYTTCARVVYVKCIKWTWPERGIVDESKIISLLLRITLTLANINTLDKAEAYIRIYKISKFEVKLI